MNEFWGYVSERIPKPIPVQSDIDDNVLIHPDPVIVAAWEAKDEIALAFLHMIIDVNVDQNIVCAKTSKEA